MAAGDKPTIGARVSEETEQELDEYRKRAGYDDRSDALRDVLRMGLREAKGPVTMNIREITFSAAYHLTLVSVMLVVLGFGTAMLVPVRATAIALIVQTIALAPVAVVEGVRALGGQSELGAGLRGDGE